MTRAQARVYLLQELSYTGMAILVFLVELGVVIEQTGKILAGASTVGTMAALVLFVRQVFWPVIEFGHGWLQYKMNALTFSHLDQVLALQDDSGFASSRRLSITNGHIRFNQITFAYADREVIRRLQPGD